MSPSRFPIRFRGTRVGREFCYPGRVDANTCEQTGGPRMRYWWVNQNQTYRQEVPGGYLWSPRHNANGARNPFYESMREIAPGDVIFSFVDTRIHAIGMAQSYCRENPKPLEFGKSGLNWENIGWRVDVSFRELTRKIRPKDHIDLLRPLFPARYAPLQQNGNGIQSVYLTGLPTLLAEALIGLIGPEAGFIGPSLREADPFPPDDLDDWEDRLARQVMGDPSIRETERRAIVQARSGQGLFKKNVRRIEPRCRITHVEKLEHLVASHCKPWRDATNEERLDGENGLLLTPSIDHLFDRGFISFEDNGTLLISPVADRPSLARMGIDVTRTVQVGSFTSGQKRFLDYHRNAVLLASGQGPHRGRVPGHHGAARG
ncbi:hypothetical protein B1B_09082 [mine drainage metagenome]|uniref:HNH nuclease domain-containing protein n=1 Tax=mine drainage metagenome TaxID=410659 RepID=T1AHW4_9ZZZZ